MADSPAVTARSSEPAAPGPKKPVASADEPSRPSLIDRILALPLAFLDEVGATIVLGARSIAWLFRPPVRIAQFIAMMDFVGVQSLFIVALTGTFSGMVFTLQVVYALRQFSAESRVGAIVAVALTRELAPVFAGLMVSSRAGSAMAAELGNMRVSEQIDALSTMGVSPVQYLIVPRIVANVLMLPLLCMLFTIVGMAGSWLVGVVWLGLDPGIFWNHVKETVVPADLFMGEFKSAVFGFLISLISCKQGFFASGGARGVGIATTKAVVQSAVAILIANYMITSWLTDV